MCHHPHINAQNSGEFLSAEREIGAIRHAGRACLYSALALLCLVLETARAAAPVKSAESFLTRAYTNAAGRVLLFRLLLPLHYDPHQRYPAILYLHGAAARGSDNAEPLKWGPELFLKGPLQQQHGFFLVVPQCPRASGWLERSFLSPGGVRESASLHQAIELVRTALPGEYSIDPKRLYLTGVSMGGSAVWVEMVRHPGTFAAAVPVCSGGDPSIVTRAAVRYPVWAFHSDDDHLIPVEQARRLVQAWRDQGGLARYTEYTGLKHSSWKKAYLDLGMFDWLFAQHLP